MYVDLLANDAEARSAPGPAQYKCQTTVTIPKAFTELNDFQIGKITLKKAEEVVWFMLKEQ